LLIKLHNYIIIIAKLADAFDRCNICARDAVHILIATAEALSNDVHKLVKNRISIKESLLNL